MIETKNLVKIYKSKTGVNVKALDGVNLKLPAKGMVFILGKSGSGKSTLLNVLGGLDNYDDGEIIIKGKSSKDFKAKDFDSYRNTYVGFIFQEYNILDNFTVGQNIALAMKLQGKKPTSEDIDNILKQVDLGGLGDRKPNELSGGQKQRVAIARALIKNPQIIMADEPTGALDSTTGIQIFDTLKKLSEEKLVLIVSHDREFSERYADRIIEIKDGKVLSDVSLSKNAKRVVENVIYATNEVLVKPDYTLTATDLKEINAFLKKNKNTTRIKAIENEIKGRASFVDTNQNEVQMDNQGFKVIKSRLPFSHAFKMGLNGLNHKKFKLAMTIILSLVSFTMLGLSTTFMLFKAQTTLASNWKDPGKYNFFNIGKYKVIRESGFLENVRYSDPADGLTDDDINKFKSELNDIPYAQLLASKEQYKGSSQLITYKYYLGTDDINSMVYTGNFDYASSLTDAKKLYKDTDLLAGSWPKDLNEENVVEIVVPLYSYQTFKKYGLKEYEQSSVAPIVKDINEPKDLIDKVISTSYVDGKEVKFKVSGILNKGLDLTDSSFKNVIEMTISNFDNNTAASFTKIKESSESNIFICTDNTYQQMSSDKKKMIFGTLPTDSSKLNKLANLCFKEYKEDGLGKNVSIIYSSNDVITSTVRNTITLISSMKNIFLIIGLVFVVFSGLLLANFIANSISYQRKEIGILRAIGSRGDDVFKIYMSESGVIAAVNFVLATISSWAVIKFGINPSVGKAMANLTGGKINLLVFNILSVLILLAVSVIAAFLSTFLPVYLTAKKKPIDAIRHK